MKEEKEIFFLDSICTHNIWGGDRLWKEYHYQVPHRQTGECWGISAHPKGESIIRNGCYRGKKLSDLWRSNPELFGNVDMDKFPLLIKLIDAREKLSIQVHPDDVYAEEHENGSLGKTECWYILDCPEKAGLVIGHNAGSRNELKSLIEQECWKELIREVPVKKGDFIQINPGTVHAISGGFLILETQQNSDITYRVYDYGRLSEGRPRELHIDRSIDVIEVPAKPPEESIVSTASLPVNQLNVLYSGSYYRVFKLCVEGHMVLEQKYPFLLASVCEGEGYVNGTPLQKGDQVVFPFEFGRIELEGNLMIIASTIGGAGQEEIECSR